LALHRVLCGDKTGRKGRKEEAEGAKSHSFYSKKISLMSEKCHIKISMIARSKESALASRPPASDFGRISPNKKLKRQSRLG
jgi:hypothetical protein